MNKETYLKQLISHLRHMDKDEEKDIYNEYETHFISGKMKVNQKKRFPNI